MFIDFWANDFKEINFQIICVTIWLHIFLQSNSIRMDTRRDVFQAIADPTRREILGMLAHKPLNINAVADRFSMSRPAVSKHLKILTECDLVVVRQQGRERLCEMKPEKLQEVSAWVKQYEQFWAEKLSALDQYLTDLQANKD